MSRILKYSSSLQARQKKTMVKKTREKKGKNYAVETALFDWIIDQQVKWVNINGNLICLKARTLQDLANQKLPDHEKVHLNFSVGWLSNFKARWELCVLRSHGESGNADLGAAIRDMSIIKERLKNYSEKNIFNADESGLFFRRAPDKTVAIERLPGRKKDKYRFTVMTCCNADGSEKFEFMIIGRLWKPRVFKKKSGQELRFDYHANNKAWMTSVLFFGWLQRFDYYIGKKNGRKFALLIDICSAHGTKDNLPALAHVEVIFLPPNTSSELQPLDAIIIASIKLRYRRLQMERAIELIDENVNDIYKVEILTAMRWMKKIWNELPASVIQNCWRHTGICGAELDSPERVSIINLLCNEEQMLERQIAELVPTCTRISIVELLNVSGEDDFVQTVDDQALIDSVVDLGDGSGLEDSEEHAEEDNFITYAKEQLHVLALSKRICVSSGQDDECVLRGIQKMQALVRQDMHQDQRQTKIDAVFK